MGIYKCALSSHCDNSIVVTASHVQYHYHQICTSRKHYPKVDVATGYEPSILLIISTFDNVQLGHIDSATLGSHSNMGRIAEYHVNELYES